MSGLWTGARMLWQVCLDTPAALRARIRSQGLGATVKAVPKMAGFVVRHYIKPAANTFLWGRLSWNLETSPLYDDWLRAHRWTRQREQDLRRRLETSPRPLPRISVVMPVYNPPLKWLDRAIASVRDQVYANWELCIADDCSTARGIRPLLEKWSRADSRIKVTYRTQNGHISLATNSAADLAGGEFIALLDHDDELSPDALGEVALRLSQDDTTDLLYTDDDKIDQAGRRYMPQFKEDYSPEHLLSCMYFCHLLVIRRSLYTELGGMRRGFELSQDHDLALRAVERARKVEHLPMVLYHWRAIDGSTALGGSEKPQSVIVQQKAIQEALDRRGIRGQAVQAEWGRAINLGIFDLEFPDDGPDVCLIIPTRNRKELLKQCLDSLALTTYRNYRILVIDNESDDPGTLDYLRSLPGEVLRVASPEGKFNFAYLNNRAVEHTDAPYVLLLNNDTEVVDRHWLSRMMGHAQIAGVGSVGARLLYPDLKVQHAGVVHSGHGIGLPCHVFKGLPDHDPGYMHLGRSTRNVAAVTGACLLSPRKLYLELGGLDERNFRVAFNDVDYCYRLIAAGYRNVYCAAAVLKHHESLSRGFDMDPDEMRGIIEFYGPWKDPFLSPHLVLVNHDLRYRLR